MSGDRVVRSMTNKTKSTLCANCAKGSSPVYTDINNSFDSEDEVTLTFQKVLEKVFRVTFDPLSNLIKLCHTCGLQLYNLYKCYESFLEMCAIDSTLSKIIKNKNKKNNYSGISPVRPLRLKIRKDKSKDLYKNDQKQKDEKKSKLNKGTKDDGACQKNTREIGNHDLKVDLSCWESLGAETDSDHNLNDIDIEDMKPSPLSLLNDQDVGEIETDTGILIDKIEDGAQAQTQIPTLETQPDEIDIKKRLEPVMGPSGKLIHPRTCPICNKTYVSGMDMRVHLTKKHFIECGVPQNRLFRKETPHDCRICGKTLVSKGSLRSHMRFFHERQRNHKCTICNKAFPTKCNLDAHSRTHTNPGQKSALCSVCGRAFATKGYLKLHFDRHFSNPASVSTKYKFKCKLCGKAFETSCNLNNHTLEHENQRNFICDICGNSYNTEKSLKKHRAAHIDQFPCPYCERTFTRRGGLKDHLISSAHSLGLDEAKSAAGIITNKIEITDVN